MRRADSEQGIEDSRCTPDGFLHTVEDGGCVLAASPDPEAIAAAARLLEVPLVPPHLQVGLAAVRTLSEAGLRWHHVAEIGRQIREQGR